MKYLIILKPLEPFFFGGSQTFGKLGDKENGSYFAKSTLFPQQTALLGMLKKEILKDKGYLTRKLKGEWVDKDFKEDAKKLVGSEKFSIENFSKKDYGVIKNISNIFLEKDGKLYFAVRYFFDYDISLKPEVLIKYDYKKGIELKLCSSDFSEKFTIDEVFKEKIQVGNKKIAKSGQKIENNENGFFKKLSYKLYDNFKFSFFVDCEYELERLNKKIVFLGADKSKFLLETEKFEENFEFNLPKKDFEYAVLLSDSYIQKPLKEICDFAITNEIAFRYLENEFVNGKRKFKKSKTYYFYEKGSIFINPKNDFFDEIKKDNLIQIGYNKYKRIK